MKTLLCGLMKILKDFEVADYSMTRRLVNHTAKRNLATVVLSRAAKAKNPQKTHNRIETDSLQI